MPNNSQVQYSPLLTQAEVGKLRSVEGIISELAWKTFQIPQVYWTPWDDEKVRTLFVLSPPTRDREIIVYYNESGIGRLVDSANPNEILFGTHQQVPPEFSPRQQAPD